jgi:hypothetical protein
VPQWRLDVDDVVPGIAREYPDQFKHRHATAGWGSAFLRKVQLTPGVQLPETAAFPLSRECSLGAHTADGTGRLAGQLQRLVSWPA